MAWPLFFEEKVGIYPLSETRLTIVDTTKNETFQVFESGRLCQKLFKLIQTLSVA